MSIWEYSNYRPYLVEKLGAEGSRTGRRKQLAEHIPVHTTFVSQVLKGKAEFSLEQAERINTFLGHTADEGEFFLLLVLKDRAGSAELKSRFKEQIEKQQKMRLNIAKRLQADGQISSEDREKFYSSSIYAITHVLCSIPEYQTPEMLAKALNLPRERMQEIIEFLLRTGILVEESARLFPGPRHVHLGNDTELILKHHTNWRLHAINSLQFINKEDLHYSACVSLSEKDAFIIKEKLLETLKENLARISQSKEEKAFVLAFDFYNLLT